MLYNVIQLPDSSLRGRRLCYIMLYNYLTGLYEVGVCREHVDDLTQ